jgi:hypothetical protein
MPQRCFILFGRSVFTPESPEHAGIPRPLLRVVRVSLNRGPQTRASFFIVGQRSIYFIQAFKDVGQRFRSDKHQKLGEQEMQLQVTLYALAAKKELQSQPDQGLVRYLDADDKSKAELRVRLDDDSLRNARKLAARTALKIRERQFKPGPAMRPDGVHRCSVCGLTGMCGTKEAVTFKKSCSRNW